MKESLRKLIKVWDLDEENYNKEIYISKKDLEYLTNNVEKFKIITNERKEAIFSINQMLHIEYTR